MSEAIERFEVRVDDAVLVDLRERLARTRFPDQIEGTAWEYGMPVDYLRELVTYWRDAYDWRAQEARLNRLAQFRRLRDDPVECIDQPGLPFFRYRRSDPLVSGQHDGEEEQPVGGHDRHRR